LSIGYHRKNEVLDKQEYENRASAMAVFRTKKSKAIYHFCYIGFKKGCQENIDISHLTFSTKKVRKRKKKRKKGNH